MDQLEVSEEVVVRDSVWVKLVSRANACDEGWTYAMRGLGFAGRLRDILEETIERKQTVVKGDGIIDR